MRLLDTFAIIALQHNSGDDTCRSSSVSVTVSALPPDKKAPVLNTHYWRQGAVAHPGQQCSLRRSGFAELSLPLSRASERSEVSLLVDASR